MRRCTLNDVQYSSDYIPLISEEGFMIGTDCLPEIEDQNCTCGEPFSSCSLQPCGSFILRTYAGAVMRAKKKAVCTECGSVKLWDPSSEFVHSIDDDTEGGNFRDIVFTCRLD